MSNQIYIPLHKLKAFELFVKQSGNSIQHATEAELRQLLLDFYTAQIGEGEE